jgi:ABC-type transporter Mla subunit MlaD
MDAALIWAIIGLIITLAFFMNVWFVKGLIDRLIDLIGSLNEKVSSLEGEIKPVLRDAEKTLSNLEPFAKELGKRGEDFGRLLSNIEKVSDDLQATTGAIRAGVVPIAHMLAGLHAGLMEGTRALSEYRRSSRTEVEIDE